MQYFGTIETKYEEVFITSSYMYFGAEDEVITPKELKAKIRPFCWDQVQITSCSHLVIVLAAIEVLKNRGVLKEYQMGKIFRRMK